MPGPANPQSWNRYSYVLNNPLRYTDPSGHCALIEDDGLCVGKTTIFFGTKGKPYSTWERKVLRKLYAKGGSKAQHGVLYILEKNIHITIRTGWQSLGGDRAGWFDESKNLIVLNAGLKASDGSSIYSFDSVPSNWGLGTIIHEAKHLEQGSELSHSKLGEMEALQIHFDVLQHLGQNLTPAQVAILNATTLKDTDVKGTIQKGYITLMQENYPDYWKNKIGIGLYTYPDYPFYPGNNGNWYDGAPWWLRLNFP